MSVTKVIILLNERERSKEQAAKRLALELEEDGHVAIRLDAQPQLAQIVRSHEAEFLVLDYLIGDLTTGLDLQAELAEDPIRTVFLTDEPSAKVAVEALKSGAESYVFLDQRDWIVEIKNIVQRSRNSVRTRSPNIEYSKLDLRVRKYLEIIKSHYELGNLQINMCGKNGVGKYLMASSFLRKYFPSAPFITMDARFQEVRYEEIDRALSYSPVIVRYCDYTDLFDSKSGQVRVEELGAKAVSTNRPLFLLSSASAVPKFLDQSQKRAATIFLESLADWDENELKSFLARALDLHLSIPSSKNQYLIDTIPHLVWPEEVRSLLECLQLSSATLKASPETDFEDAFVSTHASILEKDLYLSRGETRPYLQMLGYSSRFIEKASGA